ncbi:MAG: hypothetical protein ABID83_03390, partial [Candidatus Omnitrophota bacterium]
MSGPVLHELKRHAPFTVFGALTGILVMAVAHNLPYKIAYNVFYTLHPMHVLLSALVTASMYKNYKGATGTKGGNLVMLLAVGYVGSIGIATLSDSIMPYLGEVLLRMPHAEPHIGFIEHWQLVIPLAGVGIAVAYFRPTTTFTHAGHVLISTWASLFHIIMAAGKSLGLFFYVAVFLFLFLAVWVPCCI